MWWPYSSSHTGERVWLTSVACIVIVTLAGAASCPWAMLPAMVYVVGAVIWSHAMPT